MRKVGIAVAILFGLVIVAVLIFWATFDVNNYRGRIQSELQTRLGRQVSLGQMHLSLFPPSFQVDNVSISDDPAYRDPRPFVKAQQVSIAIKLLPLLHKDVQIDSIELKRPNVELIKDRQGVWNFSSIGNKNATSKPESGESGSGGTLSLAKLAITDGLVGITDLQAGHPRAVYDHIDITLKDFIPHQPFSVEAAAHLPGGGNQLIKLAGNGGPIPPNDPASTPFQGTLNLTNVAISGLKQFLNSPAVKNIEGTLSGETKIKSQAGKLSATGKTTIQNARVNGLDVGYPIAADYDLSDDLNASMMNITRGSVKLGQTPLAVTGTINTKPTPADINLHIQATNVAIAEAARLASAFGIAFAPGTTVNGQLSANLQARGAADKPALNGTVSASNVQISGKDIAQPVQVEAVTFNLNPNEIRSNNFNITSGGTTVNALVGVKNYTSANPIVDSTLQAPNAQLPAVLAMAKAYGVTALDKVTGAGAMNLNMHLTGPVQSLTSSEVMRAMNGNLNLGLNNIRVAGTDVSHQLASIAGFLKPGQTDKGFTNILKLTGNVLVKDGIAQTNNLQAMLDVGNLGATGTANLVTQALNLKANAVLSKATSQQVGGTGIGGYMNTALSNSQGEIVVPMLVTGTFQNPRFAPDLQSIAQMKLKGLVPDLNNPSSGILGMLGGKQGTQAQPGQAGQQSPQDQVQNMLGGLFGSKKKQPPKKQPPK